MTKFIKNFLFGLFVYTASTSVALASDGNNVASFGLDTGTHAGFKAAGSVYGGVNDGKMVASHANVVGKDVTQQTGALIVAI